jgi:uncharacterized protein YigE (DUF2233 family)
MRKILLLFFTCLISVSAAAQYKEQHNLTHNSVQYDVFIIKKDTALLKHLSIIENTGHLNENDFFNSINSPEPWFAITACIVDSACNPVGLYIQNQIKKTDINLGMGDGSFYFKPNGYIGIDTGNIIIAVSESYNASTLYNIAIQPGTILLNNKAINATFKPDSKNRNIRCGMGIYSDKTGDYLVFAKALTPVTFYELAELFLNKFNCSNAINLSNGPVSSIHLPSVKTNYRSVPASCLYIFISL